jgi:hypothetical protein
VSKFLLKNVKVMVNAVDLSSHAFNVDTPSDKEQVDVSGFSPTGTREYLPGMADQTIEVQFENDFAAASVHATLQPLFANGTTFTVYVSPDATAAVSATNPAYGGTGCLFSYNGLSGALNARSETTATFKPAPGSSFQWAAIAPTMMEADQQSEKTEATSAKKS